MASMALMFRHGFSILTIGIIPFICVFLLRGNQFRLPASGLYILATVLATGMVLYYLHQHPSKSHYLRQLQICIPGG